MGATVWDHPLFADLKGTELRERIVACLCVFAITVYLGYSLLLPLGGLGDWAVERKLLISTVLSIAACVAGYKWIAVVVKRAGEPPIAPPRANRKPQRSGVGGDGGEQVYTLPATSEEAVAWISGCSDNDPYRTLCVNRNATALEIKKSFRVLSLRVHPDKTDIPGAEEAFKKLARASFVLNDEERRAQYDTQVDEDEDDMGDLFEVFNKLANEMSCRACRGTHKRTRVHRTAAASRWCDEESAYLASEDGDVWAETELKFPYTVYHFYNNDHGKIYDVTDWAMCNKLDESVPGNSSHVFVRLKSRFQPPPKAANKRPASTTRSKKGKAAKKAATRRATNNAQDRYDAMIDAREFERFMEALLRLYNEERMGGEDMVSGAFDGGTTQSFGEQRKARGHRKRP